MLKYTLLAAGALGLMMTVSPAAAQDYDNSSDDTYQNGPNEQIEVIAPRFREERTPLNGPIGKLSLSQTVHFEDLDLRTREGARELRVRVREAASDVCQTLAEEYPVKQAPGTNCYKTALEDAMRKADAAIRDARDYAYND